MAIASSESATEPAAGLSYVDWEELSGLDRIVATYEVGDNSVVVEISDGREIRITAWHDRASDHYVSDYEKRSVVRSGGQELRVWAQTPAYKRCTGDDAASCLDAAVLEVDRIKVY